MKPIRIDPTKCNITSNIFRFRLVGLTKGAFFAVGGTGQYVGFHDGPNVHLIPMHPLFNQKNIGTVFESLHTLHSDFLKEHHLFIAPEDLPSPVENIELPPNFDPFS